MGIVSKIQHWFKVKMFIGDLSQHRKYTTRYEDLCM